MPKHRTGLHKEISVIFDGVPIPKKSDAQQSSGAPTPHCANHAPSKPPAPDQPTSPAPESQQPTQPPPEVTPPKQSEAAPPEQPETATPEQPEAAPPKSPEVTPPKLEAALLKPPEVDVTIKAAKQAPWQQAWQQIKDKLLTPKPGVSATKQKVVLISVPVLFILLIFMLTLVLSTPSGKTGELHSFKPTKVVAGSEHEIDWQIPEPYPTRLRDPTQFGSVSIAQSQTDTSGKLIVKAIVYSKDNPCAMISGQILYVGDKISGATIIKINKRSVEFEMNGRKWTQKVQ